jgi:hypothetical protein
MGTVGLDWQPASDSFGNFSIGNFSSLGESDMFLRSQTTGGLEVYDISHNQITNAAFMGTVGLDWFIVGVGDFSSNPGRNRFDDAQREDWRVRTLRHCQQPHDERLLYRHGRAGLVRRWLRPAGAFEVYDIANNQITNAVPMGSVGLDWNSGGFADRIYGQFGLNLSARAGDGWFWRWQRRGRYLEYRPPLTRHSSRC